VVNYIVKYFRNTRNYSAERFILEMFLILFVIKYSILGISFFVFPMFGMDVLNDFEGRGELLLRFHWVFSFFLVCIFMPFFETITAQMIPILVGAKFINSKLLLILISASIFTYLHSSYPAIILVYIFFAGIIYAWSFITYRKEGCFAAVFITSIIHGLSNLPPFLSTFLFR
jgi:membrane protease YdiL (CAAX protease family)